MKRYVKEIFKSDILRTFRFIFIFIFVIFVANIKLNLFKLDTIHYYWILPGLILSVLIVDYFRFKYQMKAVDSLPELNIEGQYTLNIFKNLFLSFIAISIIVIILMIVFI